MSGTTINIDDAVGRFHIDEFDETHTWFSLNVKQAGIHVILTYAEVHEIILALQKVVK